MTYIDENTILLIQSKKADGSQIFTDSGLGSYCPNQLLPTADVKHSTDQSKFETTSIKFDGAGDYIQLKFSNYEFDFTKNDFTVDWWEYFPTGSADGAIISRDSRNYTPYIFGYHSVAGGYVYTYMSSTASSWNIASALSMGSIIYDTWTHYAIVRKRDTLFTFQNGTLISTLNITATPYPAYGNADIMIGKFYTSVYFTGYMEEFRISNIARYINSFTVETSRYQFPPDGDGWLDGWKNRIKFTVDNTLIDDDLTNFPILIKLSSASGITSSDLSSIITYMSSSSNRKKIAITTRDGVSQCYGEIGWWDSEVWIHFKAPYILYDADTDFYLYYDIEQSDNTDYIGDIGSTPGSKVWNSHFKGVYHLGAGSTDSLGIKDSTIVRFNGSTTNVESEDFANNYVDLDGSNERISFGISNALQPPNAITIEALVNADTISNNSIVQYGKGSGQSWGIGIAMGLFGANKGGFGFYNGAWRLVADPDNFPTSALTHVTGSHNAFLLRYFINGTQKNSTSYTGNFDYASINGLNIGSYYASPISSYFDGKIYEVRISIIERASAWVKASAKSLLDILLTYSSPESMTEISGVVQVEGSFAERTVIVNDRDTGEILDTTTSDSGDGSYSLFIPPDRDIYVVCLDPDNTYNDLILGKLTI